MAKVEFFNCFIDLKDLEILKKEFFFYCLGDVFKSVS